MNEAAARIVAEKFMNGFFDTVGTLAPVEARVTLGKVDIATAEAFAGEFERPPVIMRAQAGDLGVVAVAFSPADVLRICALAAGAPPVLKDTLSAEDVTEAAPIFEACLGGGAGALKALYKSELALSGVSMSQASEDWVSALLETVGPNAYLARFMFEAGQERASAGALLVQAELVEKAPADVLEIAGGPHLSAEEMDDILSGFSTAPVSPAASKPGAASRSKDIERLGRVLDIRLEAKARLGRVLMPVGEILGLGPGSIIDLGRLVDEPIELLVNEKLIARGEVVVVDEKFGLRITEIVTPEERIEKLR